MLTASSVGTWRTIGRSALGEVLTAFVRPGRADRTILVFGGFHGDEPKGVFVARRWVELLSGDPRVGGAGRWIVVPVVNPDGFVRRKRRNARGVDLNRNFPTRDWSPSRARSRMCGGPQPASEPETRAVIRLIERYRPRRIVTIHSISDDRFCNNYNGPARALATAMFRHNRYPVTASIGYPTPGSFGTWAGRERGIAVVTLELPSHHSSRRCWDDNREALLCCGRSLGNVTTANATRSERRAQAR